MRTNPPAEDRAGGEGKNPNVVGEPGGLKRDMRDGTDRLLAWQEAKKEKQTNHSIVSQQTKNI